MIALLLLACGGGTGATDATGPSGAYPADGSAAGIAAYLDSGAWQQPPWVSESDGPRDATSAVSPHGRVRVWMNDVLAPSVRAGSATHPTGAMAVKELFDDADLSLGRAVMLKLEGDAEEWAYYCDGPDSRCGDTADPPPIYGVATETACGFCHAGVVFNTL